MDKVLLSEIATFKQGKQIPVEEQSLECKPGMKRFVRIVDYTNPGEPPRYIEDAGERYEVSEKDIVMIRYGSQTAGMVVRGISGIIANNMFQICIEDQRFDIDYMYYFLSSPIIKNMLMSGQSSSTMPAITFGMMSQIEIPVRPIEEQRKVVSFLDIISKKIDICTRINSNLEAQLQSYFKEWFVDYPGAAEWEMGTFSELIESTLGGDWGKETETGNYNQEVYCVRGADIPEVKKGNKGKMPTRYILPKNYEKKKLVDGDLVIEISGGSPTQSTGRIAAITESLLERYDSGMVCTNFCRAIKPKKGYSMFVYYYWQYLYDKDVFFLYENGTTGIKNLDLSGFLENEEIIIPPLSEIERFTDICNDAFEQIFLNGLQKEKWENLYNYLLPRVIADDVLIAD